MEYVLTGEKFDGGTRLLGPFGGFFGSRPLRKDFAPLLDPDAIAEIVTKNDIEAGQKHTQQEIPDSSQRRLRSQRQVKAIIYIAVQNELIHRLALVQSDDFPSPGWQRIEVFNRIAHEDVFSVEGGEGVEVSAG